MQLLSKNILHQHFRCYRQLESSDCGLTCIRMITKHYGVDVPLSYLKSIIDLNRLGMSVRDIMTTLGLLSMESIAVKIEPDYCYKMPLPAILHWQQNHFVVLHKIDCKKRIFYIADPAQGKIKYEEDEFIKYWVADGEGKGIAIVAEPKEGFLGQQFQSENIFRNFFKYLFQFFKLHRKSFILTLLTTFLIMGADFVVPVLLQKTVDDGIAGRDVNLVWLLLLSQLCVAAGGIVASGVVDILLTKTGLKVNIAMIRNFLDKLAKFPLSFFDRKVSSDFMQKMQDQHHIKDFLLDFPGTILLIALSLIVFSSLLCYYSPLIFAFFILMSLIELGWNGFFLNRKKVLDYAFFNLSSINHNNAYELTNGMADLKVNNAESSRIKKWNEIQEDLNNTLIKSEWLSKIQSGGHTVISRIKDLSVTGIAAGMVIYGDLTLGTLMTLSYITGRLSQPFSKLSSSFFSLQNAMLSFQRIEEVVSGEGKKGVTRHFIEGRLNLRGYGSNMRGHILHTCCRILTS